MKFKTKDDIVFFIKLFEEWQLLAKEWTHEAHLVTATYYLHKYDFETALNRIRKNIKAFNIAHGGENTETEGYHETITVFYMQEIAKQCNPKDGLIERTEAILDSRLMDTKYVFDFYTKEKLMSVEARLGYVER